MTRLLLVLGLLLSSGTLGAGTATDCKLNDTPIVISKAKHQLHQVWTVADSSIFWSSKMPESPSLQDFHTKIRTRLKSLDPFELLRNQYLDFLKSNDPRFLAETAKVKQVLDHNATESAR